MQKVRNTVVELYEILSSFIVSNIKSIEIIKLSQICVFTSINGH